MVIHRRTGWTGQTAPRALLAVLSAVALFAGACSSEALRADEAATVSDGSSVEYAVSGGEWTQQDGGGVVPAGARVRTAGDEARLEFRGGAVRLSPNALATVTNDVLTLERGEALVASTSGLSTSLEDTTIDGAATYRVETGLAARVGVYRGEVAVARPAQERTVPSLRQLNLADVRLATRPAPLRYLPDDVWDRDLLGDAIAFDGEAAQLTRGMDRELGTEPLPPAFYRRFTGRAAVPVLAQAAEASRRGAFGPPSDVLLTFFVAQAAGTPTVVPAIRQVAGLRSAGARWGLIAVDLGVPADDVMVAIDRLDNRELALGDLTPAARTPADPAGGTADDGADPTLDGTEVAGTTGDTTGTTTNPTTTTGGSDPGDGDGGGGDDPAPPPDDDPPVGPSPPPPPPPPEDPTLGDVVTGAVNDVAGPTGEDEQSGAPLSEELDTVRQILDADN